MMYVNMNPFRVVLGLHNTQHNKKCNRRHHVQAWLIYVIPFYVRTYVMLYAVVYREWIRYELLFRKIPENF